MNITYNEVVETLALAIANRNDYRAVLDCTGNESILIDFSYCGDPLQGDVVCVWSHQRDRYDRNLEFCGTDELDSGSMESYDEVFGFVLEMACVIGTRLYVESF